MENYSQQELIGSGTYAKVYKGIEIKTQKLVAIKHIKISKEEGMPPTALREISILKNIKHINIVKLLQVIHKQNLLCIVFEYIEYELMAYIEKYGNVYLLCSQLFSGIAYLHAHNIIHRDLKPSNILVSKTGILKIADFGLARTINKMDLSYSSEVVTLWYRSPELLMGAKNYKFEIDIWSLGCILYEMVTRTPLFPGKSRETQLQLCNSLNLEHLNFIITKQYKLPESMFLIISKCLDYVPARRITIDDILVIFNFNCKF